MFDSRETKTLNYVFSIEKCLLKSILCKLFAVCAANITHYGFSEGLVQNKQQKNNMFQSDSRLLSESRWLVTPGFMTVLHLSKQFEQSNYPLLSPGCRNEGLTHLDCLKGSIAVRAGDTFSPIVTFPLVSLNLC